MLAGTVVVAPRQRWDRTRVMQASRKRDLCRRVRDTLSQLYPYPSQAFFSIKRQVDSVITEKELQGWVLETW